MEKQLSVTDELVKREKFEELDKEIRGIVELPGIKLSQSQVKNVLDKNLENLDNSVKALQDESVLTLLIEQSERSVLIKKSNFSYLEICEIIRHIEDLLETDAPDTSDREGILTKKSKVLEIKFNTVTKEFDLSKNEFSYLEAKAIVRKFKELFFIKGKDD